MQRIISLIIILLTIFLNQNSFSQNIYAENFNIPEKGVWADSLGNLHPDFSGIEWTLDYSKADFSDENDYAKTVPTGGGRFEVLDSDAEITWSSPEISIAAFDLVNVSLTAGETGSSTNADKKYVKAFYQLNNEAILPFDPVAAASGNWGESILEQRGIKASSLKIILKLNSSYSNDKVIVDDILVEGINTSDLEPARLQMLQQPTFGFVAETLELRVVVFNKIGEVYHSSELPLLFESSEIEAISKSYENGIYTWQLKSNFWGLHEFSIIDESELLNSINAEIQFYQNEDVLFFEDFESEPHLEWSIENEFEISSDQAISENNSLKHIEKEEGGNTMGIATGFERTLNDGNYLFSFKLRNGDWSPSSSNHFSVGLMNDHTLPDDIDPTVDGLLIGVNETGSSDVVSVWFDQFMGKRFLLLETDFEWKPATCAQIDLMLLPTGEMTLHVTDLVSGKTGSGVGINENLPAINHFSINFEYTVSRSGELWFDDLLVIRQNTSAFIKSVQVNSNGQFEINFSEAIKTENLTKQNFLLASENGMEISIQSIEIKGNTCVILETETVTDLNLIVAAYNIEDQEGLLAEKIEFEFQNLQAPVQFDVVINEILADPTPSVGMPEAEFVEILNRSEKHISTAKWLLVANSNEKEITAMVLGPGEFIILCDADDSLHFSAYGKVLPVPGFPTLHNGGANLKLLNERHEVLDEITYSDDWYYNKQKDDGGYSLERIDPNRNCAQPNNWRASQHPLGATPGQINSIAADNIDEVPVAIWEVTIESLHRIVLSISEPVTPLRANDPANYSIDPLRNIDSVLYEEGSTAIAVFFKETLLKNHPYTLTIHELSDGCGNLLVNALLHFSLVEIEPGQVLINELLFNPFPYGADFVELFNNSAVNVDLADLKLATRGNDLKLKSVYEITDSTQVLKSGEWVAVTKDTTNIFNNYPLPLQANLFQVEKMPAYNDAGGRVVLLNDSLQVIDEFEYADEMHDVWLASAEGVSLERLSCTVGTNEPGNWHSAGSLTGYATPGYKNSQTNTEQEEALDISLEPEVISPNNDSYNDKLIITFKLDETGYLVNLYIFDTAGRQQRRLLNNVLVGNQNQIHFDGKTKNGATLPLGAYVLLAELVHSSGKTKVFKKSFWVTDRVGE